MTGIRSRPPGQGGIRKPGAFTTSGGATLAMSSRVSIVLAAVIAVSNSLAQTTIYECRDEHGQLVYTDRSCSGQQTISPRTTPPVRFAPLAPEDQQRLQAASRRAERQRQLKRKARAARARQQHLQRVERERQCRQAHQGLRRLQAKRRKGYALSAHRKLDKEERSLKQARRRFC